MATTEGFFDFDYPQPPLPPAWPALLAALLLLVAALLRLFL